MIDLTIIKPYIDESESFVIHGDIDIKQSDGICNYLDSIYDCLDCSKILNDKFRTIQTIDYTYRYYISQYVYIVDNYITDLNIKEEYYKKLIQRHLDNIEYEKVNTPVWYGTEKDRRKSNRKHCIKEKKTKSNSVDKSKKPSVAERKLAAKVAKINALSIKIKPKIKL